MAKSCETITSDEKFKQEILAIGKSCILSVNAVTSVFQVINSILTKRQILDTDFITKELATALCNYTMPSVIDREAGEVKFRCYPKIEGGNNYQLHQNNNSQNLQFDVISCTLGIDYKNYVSYYGRTLLVNPTLKVKEHYNFMQSIEESILQSLRDGVTLSKVYKDVIRCAKVENKLATDFLSKEFGFLLFSPFEKELSKIDEQSKIIAKEAMIFKITVELNGLEEEGRKYRLFNTDTVLWLERICQPDF